MVGGPSKVCARFCGLGPPGDRLLIEVSVYGKGLRHVVRAGTAWGGGAKGGICGISLGGFGAFGADDIIGYPIFPSFLLL